MSALYPSFSVANIAYFPTNCLSTVLVMVVTGTRNTKLNLAKRFVWISVGNIIQRQPAMLAAFAITCKAAVVTVVALLLMTLARALTPQVLKTSKYLDTAYE